MATALSDILPSGQRTAFGLSIKSLSMDINPPKKTSSQTILGSSTEVKDQETRYTLILVQDEDQEFELRDLNFRNGVSPLVNLVFGELDIIASVISWEETLIDANGKNIFTVTLTSNSSLFLKSFKVISASYVDQPEIVNNTILVPTIMIDGKTVGPSVRSIFAAFAGKVFDLAENTVFFNFENLDPDLNTDRLPEILSGETTLYDIIQDFTSANNFDYALRFQLVNGNMEISFAKTSVVDESTNLSTAFDNILDAIADADSDKVISFKKGFTITENFVQQHGGGIEPTDFLTQKIIHVVHGGYVSNFLNFTRGDVRQFWGFDSQGDLITEPDDIGKMEQILNNENITDDDIEVRKSMNLWGRQYIVSATNYTEIAEYTPEQLQDIANEQQAMVDFCESLLVYFNSLPPRHLGDPYRNPGPLFRDFVSDYFDNHPELTDSEENRIIEDAGASLNSIPNPLEGDTLLDAIDEALNGTGGQQYPSVDQMQLEIGTQISLEASNLDQARITRPIPSGTDLVFYSFPSGTHPLAPNSEAQQNFRNIDGRWPSYIELPELPENVAQTQYSWASKIISSVNHVESDDRHFIKVNVRKYKNYFIITLPGQAIQVSTTTVQGDGESGEEIDLTMALNLENVFISSVNTQERYGPFIVLDGELIDEQSSFFMSALNDPKYKIVNIVDDRLVPEKFSNNGELSRSRSVEEMEQYIASNVNSLGSIAPISQSFGTLEVAGLPREEAVNGTVFPDGAMISRISISFGVEGIKTIYYITSEPIVQTDPPKADKMPDDPVLDSTESDAAAESDPVIKEEELPHDLEQVGLSDKEMAYIYKKPEGGLGVVVGKEGVTGPFYTVRRLNYADIDPQTFAGGLNITESYFLAEWKDVRNLAEPADSFGYILPGTRVTVSIFSEGEHRPQVAYFEQTPPVFAPPIAGDS